MTRYIITITERWSIEADSPEQATDKWKVEHENWPISETDLPADWASVDDEMTFLDGSKWAEEDEEGCVKCGNPIIHNWDNNPFIRHCSQCEPANV